MLFALISSFFGWLPAGLWVPICAILSVALLSVVVKIIMIILDLVFKFIDIFI